MPTACGTVSLGSLEQPIDEDTAVEVVFDKPFDQTPKVVVFLAGIEASSSVDGKCIDAWISDESNEGFRLHAMTWGDAITWTAKLSWIASSDGDVVQLGQGPALGGWPEQLQESDVRQIDFPTSFRRCPSAVLGISSLDACPENSLHLWSDISVAGKQSFNMHCESQAPSVTFYARLSWIASGCPRTLQCGEALLGSTAEPIKDGQDHHVAVSFEEPFVEPPRVVLALSGLFADHEADTRIDTWAEKITDRGFRLHIRSWDGSTVSAAKVSWIAVPPGRDSKVHSIPSHSPPRAYIAMGEPLGKGCTAVTWRAKHRDTGAICAVKSCTESFEENERVFLQELQTLQRLPEHCNLLRYHSHTIVADRLHLVTEYIDALSLSELVPGPQGPWMMPHRTEALLGWMAQLLDGVACMHSAGIWHRDLHSDNILVERTASGGPSEAIGALRIIDFGSAKVHEEDVAGPQKMSREDGWHHFLSPERRRLEPFDERDDVWAAGINFLIVSSGRMITKREDCGKDGGDFPLLPLVVKRAIEECPLTMQDAVRAVLVSEPAARPTAKEALEHVRRLIEAHAAAELWSYKQTLSRTQPRAQPPRAPLKDINPCALRVAPPTLQKPLIWRAKHKF